MEIFIRYIFPNSLKHTQRSVSSKNPNNQNDEIIIPDSQVTDNQQVDFGDNKIDTRM
jgi:hypothetical protein